ncbi:MAG: septal ring lytic transglycosylase RlpA family protein [Methylotenera sp.]|jgi:peptidoglycan lytic transglycosylase
MKKLIVFAIFNTLILTACSSSPVIKRSPPAPAEPTTSDQTSGGGYYPGDGPHVNPPSNLDAIPDAVPKKEALYKYSTKPYIALGKKYTPLQSADNYKKQGIASWYGKLFHGNKTANGEVYDMYSMTAAHTVLPLPSYAKVTNLENGRSVIVRINDRGPFKHDREIDLSYAAAYKLRLIEKGSGLVEVEAINPDTFNQEEQSAQAQIAVATTQPPTESSELGQHYVQAGAFGEESNAAALQKRIQNLNIEENAKINRVYNNGLHRLLVGPYQTRQAAELAADNIRNKLNISTIITIQ